MSKVIIYQRVLPHYRLPFFEVLYAKLSMHDINLVVIAGQEKPGSVPKTVYVDRPWVEYRENVYFDFFSYELVFQRIRLIDVVETSGVIVEQSNRLVANYILLFYSLFFKFKLGLWGHGKNFQSKSPSGLRERFKAISSRAYDYWFSYTEKGKVILTKNGCNPEKVMVVNNSIDLSVFDQIESIRSQYYLKKPPKRLLGIYCGGMYSEKNIPFLLNAIECVKDKLPEFEMLFIGDGPDSNLVVEFSKKYDWITYVGSVSGPERAKYFAEAQVFLLPGLVGLAVLDSFASQVPLLTTNLEYHSPEIDYLKDGFNGRITKHNVSIYANEVVKLLSTPSYLEKLKDGCRVSSQDYSVERMADNFTQGILSMIG